MAVKTSEARDDLCRRVTEELRHESQTGPDFSYLAIVSSSDQAAGRCGASRCLISLTPRHTATISQKFSPSGDSESFERNVSRAYTLVN